MQRDGRVRIVASARLGCKASTAPWLQVRTATLSVAVLGALSRGAWRAPWI